MAANPVRYKTVVDAPKSTRPVAAVWIAAMTGALLLMGGVLSVLTPANAEPPTVLLGTADPFAILAGSAVTNTGPSVINGDVGVHPGTAITGFPPGTVNGTIHSADPVAQQAKDDLVTAYNDAAGRPSTAVATELGGNTFFAGVYSNSTELGLTGTVTLDGQNDPSSVWIFQAGSTLITASNSTVALINGADPCNVFWQVGSSATLGTDTTFVGTILALTSITVETGSTVQGRALAQNGAVTLDTNVFNLPDCAAPPTSTETSTTATSTTDTTIPTTTETTTTDTTTPTTTETTTTDTTVPTTTETTTPTTTDTTIPTTTETTTTETTATSTETSETSTSTSTETSATSTETSGTSTATSATQSGGGTTTTGRSGGGGGGRAGGGGGGGNGGGGQLAYTGTALPTMSLLSIGAGVLLIGTALLLLPRRPRPKHV